VPSASPVASAQDLVEGLLDFASQIILPDWRALVDLFPILLAVLFVAWFALTFRKFATLGPRRRAPARIQPITPPSIHMPGGSHSPILAAIGAGALFLGLVFGGVVLLAGVILLVVTLLFWFREGMREYQQLEPAGSQLLPAIVHTGPPPGVHMPGPSILPFLGALGAAVLVGGLVMGGWVLLLSAVFLAAMLLLWLFDFKAEYRKVEEADRTGHLENIKPRGVPKKTLAILGVLLLAATAAQLGFLTPPPATGEGGGTASPAASGAAPGGAPPGSIPLTAVGIAFDQKELSVPADQPFTIYLTNNDPPSTPHDVEIRTPDGKAIKAVPPTAGGEAMAYAYDALPAGGYVFICSIHPIDAMTGTLKVQ